MPATSIPPLTAFTTHKIHAPNAVDAQTFAKLGLAALSGEKGPVYDRIVLNAALTDHLLGFNADPRDAIQQAREAIDNGRALKHLRAYSSQ